MMHTTIGSPIGEILITGDGSAVAGLYTSEHVRRPRDLGRRDESAFVEVRAQLGEYFAGDRVRFDVELCLAGTPFQQQIWRELLEIGYGQTTTYGQLAAGIGAPRAVRAVGMANGRNPISIIVPCHRVIGRDGKLTGYAGGLAAKRWLLDHELANRDRLAA